MLKLGPQSKESANFFNKVWHQDCRFVPEVSRLTQRQTSCDNDDDDDDDDDGDG